MANYAKNVYYFGGSNTLTDMNNNYHLDLYINDHLITRETDTPSYLYDKGGSTKKTDKIQLKCRNGYKFDGNVYYHYEKGNKTGVRKQTTVSENDTIATYYIDQNDGASNVIYPSYKGTFNLNGITTPYLTVVASAEPSSVSFIKTLSNCSVSPAENTLTIGVPVTVTITANSGYIFDAENTPVLYWIDNEETEHEISLTKVSDYEYTATFTPDETDYYLNASAISEPTIKTVNFIKTLSNCSVSPAENTLTIGVPVTVTITANSGYIFDAENTPVLYWIDNEETEHEISLTKVSDYEYTATFTPDETDYYLKASAIIETSSVSFEKNLTNCDVTPNVNSLIDGETYSFIFKADSGYIFDVAPSLRYLNSESNYITCPLTKISDYEYRYNNLTIDADNMTAFYATGYASAESVSSNKYGVLQIHKIDADTLKTFNDLRYYDGNNGLKQIDLSQYISALKVIFVDVASTASDNILVSNINTGISAPKIDDDYITLDLGNVLLAGMYRNALDKKYSEILLKLPFVDVYKLDSDYMNETINIKYRINLISGDGAIFISIVRDSETFLIDVINVNMSFDLPYVYPIENDIKQLNTKIKAVNFNISPSVTIKQRLKADANNSVYQCYKIDTPARENGYFKIERLDADTIPASASIRNKIENLLKTGVYI